LDFQQRWIGDDAVLRFSPLPSRCRSRATATRLLRMRRPVGNGRRLSSAE